jgi:hypothetical protein
MTRLIKKMDEAVAILTSIGDNLDLDLGRG